MSRRPVISPTATRGPILGNGPISVNWEGVTNDHVLAQGQTNLMDQTVEQATQKIVKDITLIPEIMDNKKWEMGAKLMRKWFDRKAFTISTDLSVNTPAVEDIITMEWVKDQSPADSHYTAILEDSQANYKTANSNKLLVEHLSSELNKLKVGESVHFNHFPSGQKASALHAKHIQTRTPERGDAGTDLTAALARFAFHLLAKGTAHAKTTNKVEITIHTVGIYLRDSYDFTDDGWTSQPLGCWDFKNMLFDGTYSISPFNDVYCVNNADFRDWRSKNKKGGDFRVFSDIEEHKLTPPYIFEMPYTFKE